MTAWAFYIILIGMTLPFVSMLIRSLHEPSPVGVAEIARVASTASRLISTCTTRVSKMRIRTASWSELVEEPTAPKINFANDTHCWCARPGGCHEKLDAGPAGRLCDICTNEHHPILDPRSLAGAA